MEQKNEEPRELLKELIEALSNKKCKYGKCIKNRRALLRSLKELDSLVGLKQIKSSIALQTAKLIVNEKKCKSMLNTILCGGPGLGKTTVGKIMAKIWLALGYLDTPSSGDNVKVERKTGDIGISDRFLLGLVFVLVLTYVMKAIISLYQTIGYKGTLIAGSLLGLTIMIGMTYIFKRNSTQRITTTTTTTTATTTDTTTKDEDSHIVVLSRSDFVAGYVGQTAKQTRKLLNEHEGKVIFIDEAYSLFHGPRDPYGMEALTEIVLYMGENPTRSVFILAGYKDKLEEGVLKVQPGLLRRCMWHFTCDTYNESELSKIFEIQLERENWSLSDSNKCSDVINQNFNEFKNFAGDTERLGFLSSLGPSFRALIDNNKLKTVLSPEDITDGIRRLKENNI